MPSDLAPANVDLDALFAARRREAATREILEVISQSRDDETRVFDLVVDKAVTLCEADQGSLLIVNEARTHVRLMVDRGHNHTAWQPGAEFSLDLPLPIMATIRAAQVVHIEDFSQSDAYRDRDPIAVRMVETEGHRTRLIVPLLQNGIAIGGISLSRRVVRPFTPDEIALVETFAAQAVVAIENVRQFRELQTRLAREAATREILEVISQSRDDDLPVFRMILTRALHLCEAAVSELFLVSADRTAVDLVEVASLTERPPQVESHRRLFTDTGSGTIKAIVTGTVVHIPDITDTDRYRNGGPAYRRAFVGQRTTLLVPLLASGVGVGALCLWREEVKPFTPDEIALVETFAAQAVIAIENVRQFRELQVRLAREEATREILEVISQSRDDDRPVFDAILRNANRLCGTSMATLMLGRPQDKHMVLAAYMNPLVPTQDALDEIITFSNQTGLPMDAAEHSSAKAILTGEVVQIADLTTDPAYLSGEPTVRIIVEDMGVRAILSVPLFDAQGAMGAISLHRQEAKPFRDDEISLIQSFAAQAVIAIENVRQFRELQTRLAREAATREILEVISHSRDDDRPVFDAILRNATRLCGADSAALLLGTPEGPHLTLAALNASNGLSQSDLDRFIADINRVPMPMDPALHISARAICTAGIVHITDLSQTEGYLSGEASFRFMVEDQGVRTTLAVPIIGAQGPIGSMSVHRNTVRPYTDDEIALIQSFAAQAVIAIENVRQFKALEALNAELGDRVQAQVGEIERMGRLKRFLPAAVADAVVSSGSEKMLRSHRALLGVLFCDIRGFTAFCETAEPEETIEVLQTYHDEMGRLIEAHGAGVDHRMGDGIMVLFNDPLPCDDPAGAAVRLGVAMRARMAELCARWKKMGHRLGFGVGISLGYATVGMVGSGGRFDYTASGSAVNLAARLCEDALDGEILLSQRAATSVEDDWAVEPRGERAMKGIREPVPVFCVTAPA